MLFLIIEGGKMTTAGVTAPLTLTMRKPLSEVNRMDSTQQGCAKEPLTVKSSLPSGKATVSTKPQSYSQSSHKSRLPLQDKQQSKPKASLAVQEQVYNNFYIGDSMHYTDLSKIYLRHLFFRQISAESVL